MTSYEVFGADGLITRVFPVEKKYNAIPSKDILPKLAKMFGVETLKIKQMYIDLNADDVCEVTVVFYADERAKE